MGQVGLLGGILACVFALVAGDLVLYAGGRLFGAPLLTRLTSDGNAASRFRDRLWQSGGRVVLFGRFVPGARLPTYVAAGALRFPVARFCFFLILAALLWAPVLVGLTALGGSALELGSAPARSTLLAGICADPEHRDRSAARAPAPSAGRTGGCSPPGGGAYGAGEFWPIWAIYAPLVPGILREAIRWGSLRAVTPCQSADSRGGSRRRIQDRDWHCPLRFASSTRFRP